MLGSVLQGPSLHVMRKCSADLFRAEEMFRVGLMAGIVKLMVYVAGVINWKIYVY